MLANILKSRFIINKFQTTWNLTLMKYLSTNNSQYNHYDIIIAGGGMVGTSLACAIGHSQSLKNKKVLLLEGAPPQKEFNKTVYSNRVSAINQKSKNLLSSIGAWDHIEEVRWKGVKQMQVWDALSGARVTFQHDNYNDICYIIENDLIIDSVVKTLQNMKNIEVKHNSRIENFQLICKHTQNNIVTLKSGEQFECDLLIGADGVNSLIRKTMENKEIYEKSYNQMGVVGTIELENAGDNSTAWQRFLPTGPVALLPLSENLSSLVWSTTPEHAKELISMSPENFVDALNSAYANEHKSDKLALGVISTLHSVLGTKPHHQLPPRVIGVKDKSRAGFPLGFLICSTYVNEGVALVGDAAHRIHPIAGQGVNLGFADVDCLVDVLSDAVSQGSKLSNLIYLLKYEQNRLQDNVPMMLGIHAIHSAIDSTFSPIIAARSFGLHITDSVPILKKFFMQRAMG